MQMRVSTTRFSREESSKETGQTTKPRRAGAVPVPPAWLEDAVSAVVDASSAGSSSFRARLLAGLAPCAPVRLGASGSSCSSAPARSSGSGLARFLPFAVALPVPRAPRTLAGAASSRNSSAAFLSASRASWLSALSLVLLLRPFSAVTVPLTASVLSTMPALPRFLAAADADAERARASPSSSESERAYRSGSGTTDLRACAPRARPDGAARGAGIVEVWRVL